MKTVNLKPVRALAIAAMTAAFAACNTSIPTAPASRSKAVVTPSALSSIVVFPSSVSLALNSTTIFTATGRDAAGDTIPMTPTWSVIAGGGTISESGVFTSSGVLGTYASTVRASYGGITQLATVTVIGGALASITVTPVPAPLLFNSSRQFTAVGRDAWGNVLEMSPVWSVVNGGGTINSAGLFTAATVAGTFVNTVKATSGLITGFTTVTVVPIAMAPASEADPGSAASYAPNNSPEEHE